MDMLTATSPFVEGTSIQFAWDSTSLTVAMSCAQRYQYEIIQGWQPKNPEVAVALAFGSLLHYGIESYHRLRAAGSDFEPAVVGALRRVLDYVEPGEEQPLIGKLPVDIDIQAQRQEEAEDDESDGIDFRNSKIRTRYHLFRALVWYFDQYRQDALKVVILQSGSAAVEHSFRVPVGETLSDGTPLLLSGHYDKLVDFNGQQYVSDVKTTKSLTRTWREGFDLSHQMTGYTLGGKIGLHKPVKGVWIDAVQLQVGGVKFNRFTTGRSESQLREYIQLLKYTADLAEQWALNNYYPQNTAACLFCKFKAVCKQPPEFRSGYLNMYYERKPAWNPLRNR
jgi:hypothetical protein